MKRPTKQVEELINKYKADALRIANSFRSPVLDSMEKESTAMLALFRAAEAFDNSRKVRFNTVLYSYIMNDLKTESKELTNSLFGYRYIDETQKTKIKRKPRKTLKADYRAFCLDTYSNNQKNAEVSQFYDNCSSKSFNFTSTLEFKELLILTLKFLTKKQRRILGMLIRPDAYRKNYQRWGFKKVPTMSETDIAKICGISRQAVNVHMASIRKAFKQALKQSQSTKYKMTDKERRAIYGRSFTGGNNER